MTGDKYSLNPSLIKEPPQTFLQRLRFLGPGFIISASIVGSGELIATTVLGAKAGFTALWLIILSCLVKVALQLEFGRKTILTGETPMKAFAHLPGRAMAKNSAVWFVFILTTLKIVQVGGMLGGSAIVLGLLFPSVGIPVWSVLIAALVALLIYKNYYRLIERTSLLMVTAFTILTIVSLVAVSFTDYSFSFDDVLAGFGFKLSPELVIIAIGAFGITGVASDEIIAYCYWCLEKGYASYTGPREDSDAWRRRASGWIKVMYLDALIAMIVYTLVTAAFYLLGASILHGRTVVPEGNALITSIAQIYTATLGEGIKTAYLIGAFFVLCSSVFATLAYWTRLYSDIFGIFGWINFSDPDARKKTTSLLAWTLPALWVIVFLFIRLPMIMVISGGIIGSILLLLVVYAAICFYYQGKQILKPGILFSLLLWISVLTVCAIAVYGLVNLK